MKETIEYYYFVTVNDLKINNNSYYFLYNNDLYYFVYYSRTENEFSDILLCISELKNKGISVNEILLNKERSYFTKIEDLNYVLIKINNKDEKYNIIDMLNYNKKLKLLANKSELYRNDWGILWSAKIDYLENQISELVISPIVKYSIDYYIGLAENAIYYVNLINLKYEISDLDNIVLSRKRIYYPNYNLNYFNPLSFIFDLEVRDVAEYIKSVFYFGEDAFLELETYLKLRKLTAYSYNMLFARLIYPSYYFDMYEDIVNKNRDSECLIKIIDMSVQYESFIKKAYLEISKYALLEKIDWLKVVH